jgi:hypothetical protein
MSLSITQYPASASLAQSPMIFTVAESTQAVLSASFQYYCNLYYWTGSLNNSGSVPDYVLTKYPNESLVGMFDVSRIMNSTLTDLAYANPSNIKYYKTEFYWTFPNANGVTISSSLVTDNVRAAVDGYQIFQESIGQQFTSLSPLYPFMTDGPVTQSLLDNQNGRMGVWVGSIGVPAGGKIPNKLQYTASLNGSVVGTGLFTVSGSASSSQAVQQFPIGPNEANWPIGVSTDGCDINIIPYYNNEKMNNGICFLNACIQKYPNIRIKWKNRYGQFDYYNFYLVNRQGFQSTKRTYQPQLGTWQGTSLSYNSYDSSNLNYLSDSKQTLSVNSDYLDDSYNDIFKQLLVSDEIYWIYGWETANEEVRPITIKTDSVVFKTGVNDKLVQYQFDFDWGQSYKLII